MPAAVLVFAWSTSLAPAKDAAAAPRNLTQLVAEARLIVVAKVIRVTDGINAQGLPYTEVTLDVAECPKGGLAAGERPSFRQYGLVAPRKLSNGRMLNTVSPEEFPRWQEGEQVVAFLVAPARRTGLQTTVGLGQGKFSLLDGRVVNGLGNRGLFIGVRVADGLLDARERAMLDSRGPVDAATFVGLVERAVRGDWIATGQLR
ncbi:MAG: hypothetical protein EHM60_12215 [Lysobacterales bacterium]|nr:MAG: hypothetical protein EHM60_12215 [Xanthomonadales bacterium]